MAGSPAFFNGGVGSLTVSGQGSVTITFDGQTACTGRSTLSGNLAGDLDWPQGIPLGCDTTGGRGAWIGLLVWALVRRGRPRIRQ